jgi:hypothetical protein
MRAGACLSLAAVVISAVLPSSLLSLKVTMCCLFARIEDSDSKADVVINLPTAYVFGQGKYEYALLVDNDAIDAMYDELAGYNKPIITTSGTLSTQTNPTGKETKRGYGRRAEVSQSAYLGRVACPISTQGKRRQCHASTYGTLHIQSWTVWNCALHENGAEYGWHSYGQRGQLRTTAMNVDDAARLFLVAANKGEAGDVFNAGSETNVTMGAIFSVTNPMVCVPEKVITYDAVFARFGENVAWLLGRNTGPQVRRRRRS